MAIVNNNSNVTVPMAIISRLFFSVPEDFANIAKIIQLHKLFIHKLAETVKKDEFPPDKNTKCIYFFLFLSFTLKDLLSFSSISFTVFLIRIFLITHNAIDPIMNIGQNNPIIILVNITAFFLCDEFERSTLYDGMKNITPMIK